MIRRLFAAFLSVHRRLMPQALKKRLWPFLYKIGVGQLILSNLERKWIWMSIFNVFRTIQQGETAAALTVDITGLLTGKHNQHTFDTFLLNRFSIFDFNGAKIPNFLSYKSISDAFRIACIETFLAPLLFGGQHKQDIVEQLEPFMSEGPYYWQEDDFDVTVHKGDIVIDAGAWVGDFSAYAVSQGAAVYAFEPVAETFSLLEETARLNGHITPVQQGLSDKTGSIEFYVSSGGLAGNGYLGTSKTKHAKVETLAVTTLDDFVKQHNIPRVDFIKADIEGAERDMLKGARHVLKTFAPRLALCTYHLPDDPEVMAHLIKEANPAYRIIQRRKKLYACVTGG